MIHSIDKDKRIKLRDFLLYGTVCYELCVIRCDGWVVATAWIDDEDLFIRHMDQKLLDKDVLEDRWGSFRTVRDNGIPQTITAHIVEI